MKKIKSKDIFHYFQFAVNCFNKRFILISLTLNPFNASGMRQRDRDASSRVRLVWLSEHDLTQYDERNS